MYHENIDLHHQYGISVAKRQTSPVSGEEWGSWTGQAFFEVLCMGGGGGQRIIMTYFDKPFLWDGLLKYSEGNDRQRAFCFVLWSLLFSFFSFRDFGVHIDGYIAVIGHTIVVGASKVSWKCYLANCLVFRWGWGSWAQRWKSWGNPILSFIWYFLGLCD